MMICARGFGASSEPTAEEREFLSKRRLRERHRSSVQCAQQSRDSSRRTQGTTPHGHHMPLIKIRTVVSFVGGLLFGVLLARYTAPAQPSLPGTDSSSAALIEPADDLLSPPPPRAPRRRRRVEHGSRRGMDSAGKLSAPRRSSRAPVAGMEWEARTQGGPYYGDLEAPGELERMIDTVALERREIVLLHGDAHRLRMLVNLIAELNALGIFHILLLGFNEATCQQLAVRHRIGCAHSSYLWDERAPGEAGELARHRARWTLAPRYVAWIQKFHYMRLLIERRVNVLALDSDVVVTSDPYPHLHGPFGRFAMVTAFDTKGGFANINVGIVYTHNASAGGPVHRLFVEFEHRVALGLRTPPPHNDARRENLAVRFFWDQNLFNKVLLSHLIDRDVYMPDGSDEGWTSTHRPELRLVGRPGPIEHAPGGIVWQSADVPVRAPPWLTARAPWYPPLAEYKWAQLPTPYVALASANGAHGAARAVGSRRGVAASTAASAALGTASSSGSAVRPERIMLAPPWLISADNALGHRYKHWLYGATPSPCVMLHFVCVAAGERSRILPMQLFGRWHYRAVDAELAVLNASFLAPPPGRMASALGDADGGRSGGSRGRPARRRRRRTQQQGRSAGAAAGNGHDGDDDDDDEEEEPGGASAPPQQETSRRRMLALDGATVEEAMAPRPWPQLNTLHALLGGLAKLSGRALVLPAINCTDTVGKGVDFMRPGMLPNRCFWHVHSKAGVACVFRLGGCGEAMDIVSPSVPQAKIHRQPAPSVAVDVTAPEAAARGVQALLGRHADAEVVMVRLTAPAEPAVEAAGGGSLRGAQLAAAAARAVHPNLPSAIRRFSRRCPEMVDRSKRHKRECTNVC